MLDSWYQRHHRRLMPLGFGLIVLTLAVSAPRESWVSDDAFIAFRFARNAAEGLGFTWNPGQRPVEGYTNFLYVAIVALGTRLGLDTVAFAVWFGLACALANLALCVAIMRALVGRPSPIELLPSWLLAVSVPFVYWITGGLEGQLYTMLLLLAAWLTIRGALPPPPRRMAIVAFIFALAALSRPECIPIAGAWGLAMAVLMLRAPGASPGRVARCLMLSVVMPFALPLAAHLTWRLWYYGYPLPNVYYAKMGGGLAQAERGVRYIFDYFRDTGGEGVALLALAGIPFARGRRLIAVAMALLLTLLVIAEGGDALINYRFVVPVIPWYFMLAALALHDYWRSAARGGWAQQGMALLWVAGGALAIAGPGVWRSPSDYSRENARLAWTRWAHGAWPPSERTDREAGRTVGLYLREHFPPETLVAANGIGRIGYYSRLPILDRFGLCDLHIAHRQMPQMGHGTAGHEKTDEQYIVNCRPDVIVPGYLLVTPAPLEFADARATREAWHAVGLLPNDYALMGIYGFWRAYRPEIAVLPGEGYFQFYERASTAATTHTATTAGSPHGAAPSGS